MEISTSKAKQSQLDNYYYKTESHIMYDLFNLVAKKTVEGPMILFAEKDEDAIAARL